MEVVISSDILRSLLEPGKACQHKLNPQNEKLQRPLKSLVLEKMADDVVKLLIAVEPVTALESETEVQQNEVSNSSQQTDVTETANRPMQTEQKDEKNQQQQTEKVAEKTQQQQTEKINEKSQQQQTEKKELQESAFQTTSKEFTDSASQTVDKELSDGGVQTDIKEFNDTFCQTTIKEFTVCLVQTDSSIAYLQDNFCQAVTEMSSVDMQTELHTSDSFVQASVVISDNVSQTELECTDSSVQTQKDETIQECQTVLSMLAMNEGSTQTDVETSSSDVQTESSMAWMTEFGCQMAPDFSVSECQVSVEVKVMQSQTELDQQCAETQTQPDTNNRESQTDLMPAQNTTEDEIPSMPPPVAIAHGDDFNSMEPPMEGDLIPHDQIQSITPLAKKDALAASTADANIQTEPVTIIIGDAGFLIEKLKTANIKTEKLERDADVDQASNGAPSPGSRYGRSGYIPGSRLASSIISPPPRLSKATGENLRSTPVRPFNPKEVQDITDFIMPVKSASKVGRKREDFDLVPLIVPTEKARQPRAMRSGPQRGMSQFMNREPDPAAASKSDMTCPFCPQTFQQPTALYGHITREHQEQREKYKKPGRPRSSPAPKLDDDMPEEVRRSVEHYRQIALSQGLEPPTRGRPRGPRRVHSASSEGYTSPPVLEPVYSPNRVQLVDSEGANFTPSPQGRTYKRAAAPVVKEPGLFEDLPEPKRAYPRGRVRRDEADEDSANVHAPVQQPVADAYEYECPHCPERYGSASHLYSHLKRTHKREMEERPVAEDEDDEDELVDEVETLAKPVTSGTKPQAQQATATAKKEVVEAEEAEEDEPVDEEAETAEEQPEEGAAEEELEEDVAEEAHEAEEEAESETHEEEEGDEEEAPVAEKASHSKGKRKRRSAPGRPAEGGKRKRVERESEGEEDAAGEAEEATEEQEDGADEAEPAAKKRAPRTRKSLVAEEESSSKKRTARGGKKK